MIELGEDRDGLLVVGAAGKAVEALDYVENRWPQADVDDACTAPGIGGDGPW